MQTRRRVSCRLHCYFCSNRRPIRTDRRGLTWIDVVICLGIIVVLGSILLPATRSARNPARKLECLNNIRNVGIAVLNYASSCGDALPPFVGPVSFPRDSGENGTLTVGWPVILLPVLDQVHTLKSIKKNAAHSNADAAGRLTIDPADQKDIQAFRCPDDKRFGISRGILSFVINFGFISREYFEGDPSGAHRLGAISWDGNDIPDEPQDINVSAATGVAWRPNSSFAPSFESMKDKDGHSNTILLTENLQAGTWYGTDTTGLGFGVPISTSGRRVLFGPGQLLESVEKPLNCDFPDGELRNKQSRDWTINADPKAKIGTRPRPSSAHAGGVNAILCDGSGRYLSEAIDPWVYIKLITPDGASYGETDLDPRSF